MSLPLQWLQNQEGTILLLLLSLFSILWFYGVRGAKSINYPPSPPKLPILGHLHLFGKLPHRSLRDLSQKYGPIMLLHLGHTPTLVVSSAEMGREIMKTHDAIFSNRPITTASKAIMYGDKDIAFASNGEYWRQTRKLCVTDLLGVQRVRSFRFVREEEITIMVSKIKQACSMRVDVNLTDLIMGVTNNFISRVALGMSMEGKEGKSEYAKLTKEVTDHFGYFSVEDMFPSLGWVDVLTGLQRKMNKTSKAMHQFLDEVIEQHLTFKKEDAQADRKDLVDLLLEYEKDHSLEIQFTRENLRAVILDMFVAGTDTIYTVLEWAMCELVNHPNVMKELQGEVRRVVGTKSKVDENDINQMDYLNCVIKETLRLHPPVVLSIPRVSTADADIGGYHIPAKTRVIINLWAILRDPKIWDRPDEFIPERFINNPIEFRDKDYEFIPFGAGRRSCPGFTFGITSVQSILASLVYWFDWELTGGVNKVHIDMSEAFGLSVHLLYPLRLLPLFHSS